LLHKWGFSAKVQQKGFVNATSKEEEEKDAFKKGYKKEYFHKSHHDSQ
jgi:hypothetical protein